MIDALSSWEFNLLRRAVRHELELKSFRRDWRWHGIGCLQSYLIEGYVECRIHIWHKDLVLPGILDSGACHNHRFDFDSVVLAGSLRNETFELYESPDGSHETYSFVHARMHTDANRRDMQPTGRRYDIAVSWDEIPAGHRYSFPKRDFHRSSALEDVVVSLVTKRNQEDLPAEVLAPVGQPPVPAFSGELTEELFERVHMDAILALVPHG
jgi:hypothetical protein